MQKDFDVNTTGECGSMCKIGEDYQLADYYYVKSYCFGSMSGARDILKNFNLYFIFKYI